MNAVDKLKSFYDRVFGNADGKFDIKDLPNGAPAIVVAVIDIVMLVAEYRVFEVGNTLTGKWILGLGFVAISSVPYYLGQVAWLYNKANAWQKITAIAMVVMGLVVSGYFGFADLMIGTQLQLGNFITDKIDINALYLVAVIATVALIVSGLFYGLVDDTISQNLKANRLRGRFMVFSNELNIKSEMLDLAVAHRKRENALKDQYGDEYDEMDKVFHPKRKKSEERPSFVKELLPRTSVDLPASFHKQFEQPTAQEEPSESIEEEVPTVQQPAEDEDSRPF